MGSSTSYLFEAVKRRDLRSFIEREGRVTFEPRGTDQWVCVCPMHGDNDPSFTVTKMENGVWVYHCFGCNAVGTIVDFCMWKYDMASSYEAAIFAAEKEGLKFDTSLVIQAMQDAKVEIDEKRVTDAAHFVASEYCR